MSPDINKIYKIDITKYFTLKPDNIKTGILDFTEKY